MTSAANSFADGRHGPVGWRPADRFDEWLQIPVALESTHPHFDIRRARPADFDAIFDLVNAAFGYMRPRPVYDWLYRRNPYGLARCWVVYDRGSGQLLGSTAAWPWPMARGEQPVEGTLGGDWVIAPGWQRQGIGSLRADVRRTHPWQQRITSLSWPNEKSRARSVKVGRGDNVLGSIPRHVLLLRPGRLLATRGWAAPFCNLLGSVSHAALALWRRALIGARPAVAVEEVRRFTADFDGVTLRCMAWSGFWSPHDAEFLNWRYLDHPLGQYTAFAVRDGNDLGGYAVLRIVADEAWLMELAAAAAPRLHAGALLLHAIDVARDAGCTHVLFSAPPRWRHWPLLHAAGFLPTRSGILIWAGGPDPTVLQIDNWQCVPGDMDAV